MAADAVDLSKAKFEAATEVDASIREMEDLWGITDESVQLYRQRNSLFGEARAAISRAHEHLRNAPLPGQAFYRELGTGVVDQTWRLMRWVRAQIGWLLTVHTEMQMGYGLTPGLVDQYWPPKIPRNRMVLEMGRIELTRREWTLLRNQQ
jgi:hypothetical protein